jgi:nucleoside-diphosphate-sugar epimerase
MTITLVGHSGYVGQNIKKATNSLVLENLYLIDRKTSNLDFKNYILNSDVVINCAAVQRTLYDDFESFYPNFELTKKIVQNLSENSRLIFVSSIHYKSKSSFGIVRNMEEEYIKNYVKYFTIYHLPYTFGPFGKPNFNNVFNTFINSVSNNHEILLNDYTKIFPLVSINDIAISIVSDIKKNLNIVDDFEVYNTTLPNFIYLLSKIRQGEISSEPIFNKLEDAYNWYKKK